MSRQDVVNAALKAWQVAHPYGQTSYTEWLEAQKKSGKFWSA